MSAPFPYGVRTKIVGTRVCSDDRKTLAERRTPSRMATGTLRYFTMGLLAATAGPAQQARIKNSFRTEGPKIASRFVPPDDVPRCDRPPEGPTFRPPSNLMFAKPCCVAGSRVRPVRQRCVRTHPREIVRLPA